MTTNTLRAGRHRLTWDANLCAYRLDARTDVFAWWDRGTRQWIVVDDNDPNREGEYAPNAANLHHAIDNTLARPSRISE